MNKIVRIRIVYEGVDLPDEEMECLENSTAEFFVYDWMKDVALEGIRFFDRGDGKEFFPEDYHEEPFDRGYKDLYWWYEREQDYGKIVTFKATKPAEAHVRYRRSPTRVVLILNLDTVQEVVDPNRSYLYCQEMTYNANKRYFAEGNRFYFDLKDDVTFGVVTEAGSEIGLYVNGAERPLTARLPQNDGKDLLIFGTMDEDDGYGGTDKGPGEHIFLDAMEVTAEFYRKEKRRGA